MTSPISPFSNTALQQALFARADADRSGKLNAGEMKVLGGVFLDHPVATDGEAQAMVKALDTDKDGLVSQNEFTTNVHQPGVALQSATLISALLGDGEQTSNPYAALTGYSSADIANLYSATVTGTLSNNLATTYNSQGQLTGQLVAGVLAAKNLLV